MHTANRITPALFLCALASSASAYDGPLDPSTGLVLPWTGGAGTTFGRLSAAELTGDERADVVLLDGETIHVLYGPGDYRLVGTTGLTVKDFAVVTGYGLAGRDSLVYSDASGLRHAWFTFAETDGNDDHFETEELHVGEWANARRVLVMQRPDRVDLAGIATNGTDVILLADVFGSHMQMPTIPSSNQIFDLAVLDWDGGPAFELVTLSTDGLRVRRLDGSLVTHVPGNLVSGLLVPFQQEGYGHDRVAAVVGHPLGNELLVVADASTVVGGSLLELPLDLGPAGVCGLAAGDVDADGDDDLLLNWRYSDVLPLGRNQSDDVPPDGLPTFTYDPQDELDLGHGTGSMDEQAGWPVFVDADLDGDLDLLVALEVQQEVALARNTTQDHAAGLPLFQANTTVYEHDYCVGSGTLSIRLLPPVSSLTGATHVEFVLWKRNTIGADAAALAVHAAASRVADAYLLETEIPIEDEATMWTPSVYLLQLREVKLTPGGALLAAGPTFCGAFSLDPDTTEQLAAQASGATLAVQTFEIGDPDCLDVAYIEREVDSGINPLPDPGDFEDVPPDPKPGGGL